MDGVLNHPFFWSSKRGLGFLHLVSDCLQQERDNPEFANLLAPLENGASDIFGNNWLVKLDTNGFSKTLHEPLGEEQKYDPTRLEHLLSAVRNATHQLGPETNSKSPPELLFYFTDKFPSLLMHVYRVIGEVRGYGVEVREKLDFKDFYVAIPSAVLIEESKKQDLQNVTWGMEFVLYILSASSLIAGWLVGDGGRSRFVIFMILSASAAIYGIVIRLFGKGFKILN